MTLEDGVLKTNEFHQRRKLRLQQVREQSKDIAKKIRHRAKVEKLRHVLNVDSKKEKEYFECQEQFVKRLEQIYSENLKNIGNAHKNVSENIQEDLIEKKDLSKLRGKEAAADLKRRNQEKLDKQKKILDRKLKAREAANELSREKSSLAFKKISKDTKNCEEAVDRNALNDVEQIPEEAINDQCVATTNDIATQWESPKEPLVPSLTLLEDTTSNEITTHKNKNINLFALSDEMSLNMNEGLTKDSNQPPLKPSLTLVSEYLQNRTLRLRQPDVTSKKKPTEDLQSIRQTILRTRAPKTDGSITDTVCHVLDEQVIPVPSWNFENNNGLHCHIQNSFPSNVSSFCQPLDITKIPPISPKHSLSPKIMKNQKRCDRTGDILSKHLSNICSEYCSKIQNTFPSNVLSFCQRLDITKHSLSPKIMKNQKCCDRTGDILSKNLSNICRNTLKPFHSNDTHDALNKRNSVTVYNHSTRDSKCMPCEDSRFVHRETKTDDDAYANAFKETSAADDLERERLNKQQQEMRHKIAIKRQNVDKEYKETLSFLNSVPKEVNCSSITAAYVDEDQQRIQRERHQTKLQEEFKKVETESCKHNCKHTRRKVLIADRSKSKSPSNVEKELKNQKFQYSWMPVPESDGSLAIHTLPNVAKDKGNTVKFGRINSYHEYRSRHKHTPPTKDTSDRPRHKVIETLVVEQNESTESNEYYTPSETSSVANLNFDKSGKDYGDSRLSDADRIVIYKILNTKRNKNAKDRNKLRSSNIKQKQLSEISINADQNGQDLRQFVHSLQKDANLDQIKEGVYEAVNSNNGLTKVTRVCSGVEMCQTSFKWKSWWDNIEACYSESLQRENDTTIKTNHNKEVKTCKCNSNTNKKIETPKDGDGDTDRTAKCCDNCKNSLNKSSLAESGRNITKDAGILKLIDEAGQDSSKFYIGASGFLKDNNYEVIIQLRKKDSDSSEIKSELMQPVHSAQEEGIENNNTFKAPTSLEKETVTSDESEKQINDAAVNTLEDQNFEHNEEIKSDINKENRFRAPEIKSTDKLNTTDKGVVTSFQTSFAPHDQITKTDPVVRPATSTYTQTNFSSPITRPQFMHMSSSTSTAYMSPPDIILPRFLRQDYDLTSENIYDSSNSNENHTQQSKLNEHLHNSSIDKRHKKCYYAKIDSKKKVLPLNKRNISKKSVCATPPNTCRSMNRCESKDLHCHKPQHCHKQKKCRSRSETRGNKCKDSKKRLSSNTADSVSLVTNRNAVNPHPHTKLNKSNLDPVVKKYIKELISLNRESLKAVDIINQDCSDVTTPSNSVINVPSNFNELDPVVEKKISLEQIKNVLKHEIIKENFQSMRNKNQNPMKHFEKRTQMPKKVMQSVGRKRSIHKVKSLNISKRLLKNNSLKSINSQHSNNRGSNNIHLPNKKCKPSEINDDVTTDNSLYSKNRKQDTSSLFANELTKKDINDNTRQKSNQIYANYIHKNKQPNYYSRKKSFPVKNGTTTSFIYSDSDVNDGMTSYVSSCKEPFKPPTQTNEIIESDIDYMKIAEDKLKNMEKIADMTEKCTKRLSNLAKVLEEVRRNKSLVYSQISSNEVSSGSDNKSDKSTHKNQNIVTPDSSEQCTPHSSKESVDSDGLLKHTGDIKEHDTNTNKESTHDFAQLLKDIPKPDVIRSTSTLISTDTDNFKYKPSGNNEDGSIKCRTRPPPALSRHLKYGQETLVTPHELSTVVEVDSPMSVKTKNRSSRHNIIYHNQEKSNTDMEPFTDSSYTALNTDKNENNSLKNKSNKSRTDSSVDSKLQMMDMKQFNDIMLKPFISLQEYAKQYKIDGLEDSSVLEEVLKEQPFNDVISNSENSLPDVMAELLKRNMISEPFKFETGSNNNSTSLSSESTLSMLVLSKGQKKKKFGDVKTKRQNSLVETSETLSVSSNPDLENAFQKLGMGWASSTLKKTKERLALTSSSSSSSTSLRKFNIKSFNLEMPELATDSISSLTSIKDDANRKSSIINTGASLKNAVQQTSPTNSMTVKEFLNNELAKKITFNNTKSKGVDDFISLYETKMPEEIKNAKTIMEDEHSATSANSPNNNRARTSTPVQIFKCSSYRTSSSSNTSNGLFSNADDLSSVKGTSNSLRNHSTSDKEDLTIPNYSLKLKKSSDVSKSD